MEESTQEKILKAAKSVFVQKGYNGARMQEIADEAGINKAMLHYHYKSKDALFTIIFKRTFQIIIPKIGAAIHAEGSVMDKVEAIIRTYIGTIHDNPHIPVFVIHELSQGRVDFIKDVKKDIEVFPNFLLLVQQIQDEVKAGTIRAIDPFQLILNVMGLCVFPYVARPMFCEIIGVSAAQYDQLLANRADEVVRFVRHALMR